MLTLQNKKSAIMIILVKVLVADALDRCNCPGSRCEAIANTVDRCRCCIYVVLGKRSGGSSGFDRQDPSQSEEEYIVPYVTAYNYIPEFYGKNAYDYYKELPDGMFTLKRKPVSYNRFY